MSRAVIFLYFLKSSANISTENLQKEKVMKGIPFSSLSEAHKNLLGHPFGLEHNFPCCSKRCLIQLSRDSPKP